jgi:hypothetical protein
MSTKFRKSIEGLLTGAAIATSSIPSPIITATTLATAAVVASADDAMAGRGGTSDDGNCGCDGPGGGNPGGGNAGGGGNGGGNPSGGDREDGGSNWIAHQEPEHCRFRLHADHDGGFDNSSWVEFEGNRYDVDAIMQNRGNFVPNAGFTPAQNDLNTLYYEYADGAVSTVQQCFNVAATRAGNVLTEQHDASGVQISAPRLGLRLDF